MKGKTLALVALTAIFGITIGGAVVGTFNAASADDETSASSEHTAIWEQYLTDEEIEEVQTQMQERREKMKQRMEEFRTYKDNMTTEAVKIYNEERLHLSLGYKTLSAVYAA